MEGYKTMVGRIRLTFRKGVLGLDMKRGRRVYDALLDLDAYEVVLEAQFAVRRLSPSLAVLSGSVVLKFECGSRTEFVYETA